MKCKALFLVAAALLISTSYSLADKGDYGGNDGNVLTFYSVSYASTFISPVDISINTGESIDFSFIGDMGQVNVSVVNNLGLVYYNRNIDTTIDTYYTLDISSLPSGHYTVSVTNSNNSIFKTVNFEVI